MNLEFHMGKQEAHTIRFRNVATNKTHTCTSQEAIDRLTDLPPGKYEISEKGDCCKDWHVLGYATTSWE